MQDNSLEGGSERDRGWDDLREEIDRLTTPEDPDGGSRSPTETPETPREFTERKAREAAEDAARNDNV